MDSIEEIKKKMESEESEAPKEVPNLPLDVKQQVKSVGALTPEDLYVSIDHSKSLEEQA